MKYIHTLSIGGEDHQFRIKMIDYSNFITKFRKNAYKYRSIIAAVIQDKSKADTAEYQVYLKKANELVLSMVYTCLIKSGFLFWKKPFRSKKKMIKSILKEEFEAVENFVLKEILNTTNDNQEQPQSKKKETK